jgi:hypothetical protein
MANGSSHEASQASSAGDGIGHATIELEKSNRTDNENGKPV